VLYPKRRFAAERADTGISYVTRWGWANDWVTNWTSKDAYVSWDIDVITSGQYEVTLFYTCPEEDVGSRSSSKRKRMPCVSLLQKDSIRLYIWTGTVFREQQKLVKKTGKESN
jgi:hypothetical protein